MKYPKDSSLPHPGVHQAKVDARLDAIELEVEVMNKVVTKNALALCEIEERIAIMQEKIDGIY